jgi:hypothetical protein
VSRYGKSVLRYIAIHDSRITIRIAIYCHGVLLLKKDQTNTEIHLHVESFAQFVNKLSHDDAFRGGITMVYISISLCEREVIQRIQGF